MPLKVKLPSTIDDRKLNCLPETFLLFSQSLPSQDLGFINPKASTLELDIAGRTLNIAQSPTLLASDRKGGTTGAGQQIEYAISP